MLFVNKTPWKHRLQKKLSAVLEAPLISNNFQLSYTPAPYVTTHCTPSSA